MTTLFRAGAMALASALVVGAAGMPAAAQVQAQACESQQSMEQLMETEGSLTPDDCQTVTLTRIERAAGDLCVIDLSGSEGGVVDELLAVARTDQWWIACDRLAELVGQRAP